MPITFPPTPAPSTDISAKENADLKQIEPSFTLPPSALDSDHSTTPRKRRASLHAKDASPPTALPPPPTRSRKIIQMKPRTQPHDDKKTQTAPPAPKAPAEPAAGAGGKRKQPSGASAGRKIARKTAHSIIERRRREKMNEEFRVLKDMVPACAGQEMHKLAILQASIEYMQYLQSCVNSFSSSSSSSRGPHSIGVVEARPSPCSQRATDAASDEEMDDDDNDDNNDDDDNDDNTTDDHKPPHHKHPDPPTLPSPSATSPATSPRFPSLSSHTPSSPDTTTQPQSRFLPLPASHFSPVLYPQQQAQQADVLTAIDHEASTALLMLNANDRRSTATSASAASVSSRGMSVKDLLRG